MTLPPKVRWCLALVVVLCAMLVGALLVRPGGSTRVASDNAQTSPDERLMNVLAGVDSNSHVDPWGNRYVIIISHEFTGEIVAPRNDERMWQKHAPEDILRRIRSADSRVTSPLGI